MHSETESGRTSSAGKEPYQDPPWLDDLLGVVNFFFERSQIPCRLVKPLRDMNHAGSKGTWLSHFWSFAWTWLSASFFCAVLSGGYLSAFQASASCPSDGFCGYGLVTRGEPPWMDRSNVLFFFEPWWGEQTNEDP